MSLADLLKNVDGSSIQVTIGLSDLRQFHEEIVQDAISRQEKAMKAKADEEFITPDEVCDMLSVVRSTLYRWHKAGYLIPSKVGGKCVYKKSDIEAVLNSKIK